MKSILVKQSKNILNNNLKCKLIPVSEKFIENNKKTISRNMLLPIRQIIKK